VARSRVGVATVVIHDAQGNVVPPPPPAPTKGPIYLAKADRDPAVREVLQLLAGDHPDWFTLYKVMEIIQADAGGLDALTKKSDISAFGASANRADVSGEAARHARQKGATPRQTMSLDEARAFIQRVVGDWLASK
jgi:hypothetical protein